MPQIVGQSAAKLRNVHALDQMAVVLGVSPAVLAYYAIKAPLNLRYKRFTIPKRDGTLRVITAPCKELKHIQTQLAKLLADILHDDELQRITEANPQARPADVVLAHGFKRGYSIITNARRHRNRRFVFNTDIKNFFPAINFGRVRGFFMADQNFRLEQRTATLIAQIACVGNELPQGSPCSPVISNLIAHVMDIKLNRLATQHNCTYTRYADDLTFSTNEQRFPNAIAELVPGTEDQWRAGNDLVRNVWKSGFQLNHRKSRMQRKNSRQDATGLTVNSMVNVPADYYKRVRAMCHKLFMDGYCERPSSDGMRFTSDNSLHGMLSFIHSVRSVEFADPASGAKFLQRQKSFGQLYGRFLDYRSFHGIDRPRLMCEGKTDNVYIRSAIRVLKAKYPKLYDVPAGNLKVGFFRHSERSETVQSISTGAASMKSLIATYLHRTQKFKQPVGFPVIVIVDNDNATNEIWKFLSKQLSKPITGVEPFIHVVSNLYVVPIPKIKLPETEIEDLFPDVLLNTVIDGRQFDRTNKEKDGTKWYGKADFANKVVAVQTDPALFVGFEALLDRIVMVLDDFSAKLAAVPPAVLPANLAVAAE